MAPAASKGPPRCHPSFRSGRELIPALPTAAAFTPLLSTAAAENSPLEPQHAGSIRAHARAEARAQIALSWERLGGPPATDGVTTCAGVAERERRRVPELQP